MAPFPHSESLLRAVLRCVDLDPSGRLCCGPEVDPDCEDPARARCGPAGCVEMSAWDVSLVESMNRLFSSYTLNENAVAFNADLSAWNTTSVKNMGSMFESATSFNGNISSWDVSAVTAFDRMFWDAPVFQGDISSWDVSSAVSLQYMFYQASKFNSDISAWDVSSVMDMKGTFMSAKSFQGDISSWDVSSVIDMRSTFSGASSFDADITGWNTSSLVVSTGMFSSSWKAKYRRIDGASNRDGPPNAWVRIQPWQPPAPPIPYPPPPPTGNVGPPGHPSPIVTSPPPPPTFGYPPPQPPPGYVGPPGHAEPPGMNVPPGPPGPPGPPARLVVNFREVAAFLLVVVIAGTLGALLLDCLRKRRNRGAYTELNEDEEIEMSKRTVPVVGDIKEVQGHAADGFTDISPSAPVISETLMIEPENGVEFPKTSQE